MAQKAKVIKTNEVEDTHLIKTETKKNN